MKSLLLSAVEISTSTAWSFRRQEVRTLSPGTVGGEPCIISAGVVYVNDTYVGSVPYEAFVAWQGGDNEEV